MADEHVQIAVRVLSEWEALGLQGDAWMQCDAQVFLYEAAEYWLIVFWTRFPICDDATLWCLLLSYAEDIDKRDLLINPRGLLKVHLNKLPEMVSDVLPLQRPRCARTQKPPMAYPSIGNKFPCDCGGRWCIQVEWTPAIDIITVVTISDRVWTFS